MRSGRFNQFLYRQEEPITQSDIEFAHFLRTADPKRVARETFIPSIQDTLRRRTEARIVEDLRTIRNLERKATA